MKLPNGKDVNGLWIVLAILILACLLAWIPRSIDKYGTKVTTQAAPSHQQGVQA
ncbi:hypothetical protein [Sphingomonas sp. MMS24-J13]|uniref:hypothetical protein n=1 Tax=Sphingomonas sp. MMS24-J13 TaxID=3238686 RepID=UPI0038517068